MFFGPIFVETIHQHSSMIQSLEGKEDEAEVVEGKALA
jgi:hypothetical protein